MNNPQQLRTKKSFELYLARPKTGSLEPNPPALRCQIPRKLLEEAETSRASPHAPRKFGARTRRAQHTMNAVHAVGATSQRFRCRTEDVTKPGARQKVAIKTF